MEVEILFMFKLFSFESLAGNDFSERGTQAEAHCMRKKPQSPAVKYYRIVVQRRLVGITIKATAASVNITDRRVV